MKKTSKMSDTKENMNQHDTKENNNENHDPLYDIESDCSHPDCDEISSFSHSFYLGDGPSDERTAELEKNHLDKIKAHPELLLTAIKNKREKVAIMLVKHVGHIVSHDDYFNNTLMKACDYEFHDVAMSLLDYQEVRDQVNDNTFKFTALRIALSSLDEKDHYNPKEIDVPLIVKLLQSGANSTNLTNKQKNYVKKIKKEYGISTKKILDDKKNFQ